MTQPIARDNELPMSATGSPQVTLPDPAKCRIKRFPIGYCDCLADDPASCKYALHYGDGYFCHNPVLKRKAHWHGSRKLRISHELGSPKWLKDWLDMESNGIKKTAFQPDAVPTAEKTSTPCHGDCLRPPSSRQDGSAFSVEVPGKRE